ncbi:hypothetical protein [Telmatospirillum sp.]|uniref:hypothetical protein n=1 Tax=Telmatospirillum sp. TaxID=2079197 RepID=UPI00283B60D5|nr:hypothetical protein [Telmatospirillum sp.]MDR3437626.1 hypothetical protein [Telmatospirillum sp.]
MDAGAVTSDVTNAPGWRSGTWASDARITLQEMLKANGLLAEQGARYDINATLISLVAPTSGIEMDCSMTIRYQVIREADQQVAMDETVDATYTATFGDATVGAVRARLAVEGATRKNFAAFLEKLVAANPSVFGTPRI